MRYVILHDDPRTHKEVYLVAAGRDREGKTFLSVTDNSTQASEWRTAREAYEFAAQFRPLSWWRVGQR